MEEKIITTTTKTKKLFNKTIYESTEVVEERRIHEYDFGFLPKEVEVDENI